MKAEIISIGTELLLGETVDTNAAELSAGMAEMGIGVYYKQTVGDNPGRMIEVLEGAMRRSDIIIITGGLGPTEDDVTRDIVARVSGRELVLHPQALAHVSSFFTHSGRKMTDNNRRQAFVPEGAEMLPNNLGTAPGIYLHSGDTHFFCMPGVPSEMRDMWKNSVVPRLLRLTGGREGVIVSRVLRFYGIGESELETRLGDILHSDNPTLAPYAGNGEVRLRITARGDTEEEARMMIKPAEDKVTRIVGQYIYGYDDDSLESVVGHLLTGSQRTIAVAESCTGGLVAHRLTDIAGSSTYFHQGWIVYSNEAKQVALGVDEQLITEHGAVSPEVAAAMAQGALQRAGTDLALAVTGIAGPGGGSDEKPVGLVYLALAGVGDVRVVERRFTGRNREQVKWRSASEALNLARQALLESM